MSAATVESSVPQRSISVSPKWIISKRDDLIWFIGSTLTGYLAVALTWGASFTPKPSIFVFVWAVLINGPHFYATATRTYFDAEQRRKLRGYLWLIIPLSLLLFVLQAAGGQKLLFIFGAGWGSFHVAKQHVGFMMLYKRVNQERSKTDFFIDKWFLLISLMLPLTLFLLSYIPFAALGRMSIVGMSVQVVLTAGYFYRQMARYRAGEEMNWPKLMLLTLVIPLHWLAFLSASSKNLVVGFFVFTIATNIGHALQYHRLTWFHNRNRYQGKPGLSGFVSGNVVRYYGAVIGLSLFVLLIAPSLVGGYEAILVAPLFMHYFLDGVIWRVRDDPQLARALRLA